MIHDVLEGCNKLHNEDLRVIFSSANIFRMIRSGRKKGAGNVASVEKTEMY
jgi:hypothetical protein